MSFEVDVLCVGAAAYDLTFAVASHPGPDDKCIASSMSECGGGPAANASVTVARLGGRSAFAGYLGNGVFGQLHFEELESAGVVTDLIARGSALTPLSSILVKPDGKRTVVNYRSQPPLVPGTIDFSTCRPKLILFDGHEPHLSIALMEAARHKGIPTVLDAGSLGPGTEALVTQVDYVVAAHRFAEDFTGEKEPRRAAEQLVRVAPYVVITLGAHGLVWRTREAMGEMAIFEVDAVDTTGAGDAFHGAFAFGVTQGMGWIDLLQYSSAVAALCCARIGSRTGIPSGHEVEAFLAQQKRSPYR